MKHRFYLLLLSFFVFSGLFAQANNSSKLFKSYDKYQNTTINTRRFKHKDIVPFLLKMDKLPDTKVEKIGQSVEKRPIYMVQIGHGKTPVLLWSQMHGNEPTATAALLDIFNFFAQDDEYNPLRAKILDNLTLYFIPMLNPDGAERFIRRNALFIDLNRDAQRLASPESQLLKAMRERTKAKFGFNLHDQEKYYTAGHSPYPATIAFLAPAFNPQEDMNSVRSDAAKLIVLLNKMLQDFIPHSVGKWNDDFEPRAFGEMMTKWGTSTVLIESGGYSMDPERQFVRKLNFVTLLTAFEAIADTSYSKEPIDNYFKIPLNKKMLNDLIIRKLKVEEQGRTYIMDFSFRQNETQYAHATQFYNKASIKDKGDLSTFYGYEEINAEGYELHYGKMLPKTYRNLSHFLRKHKPIDILKQGYTSVRFRKYQPSQISIGFPLVVLPKKGHYSNTLDIGRNPSFFLTKNDTELAIVNGLIIKL